MARQLARQQVRRICAVCERTLLTGERALRFAPSGDEFVDVCPLCADIALEHGWIKEGSPTTPTVPSQRRRKRRGLASLFDPRRQPADDPVVAEPILRRLSAREQQMVEAADIFNASDYRRTVGGIAKSLGQPRASIVPLSGVSGELIVTSRGTSRGTSTASRQTRLSPSGSPSVDTSWPTSTPATSAGMRASRTTDGSSQ